MSQPAFTNHLIHETSPYLKQHAHNPVDWYPWGEEALRRARELNRPIFLSIGYSACHWCHVMEHESFEDPEVGKLLNDNFISIKVDREERPDLDHVYMTAVQLLTHQGGWPMSVFLTPDLHPFYGGTYFPPRESYGRPSFSRLVTALAEAWRDRRDEIIESAGNITEHVREATAPRTGSADLCPDLMRGAVTQLRQAFDRTYGGFGSAPKFPHAMEMRLLLRVAKRFGDDDALHMARLTLDRMASGGMYDQIGGGFHRYSTDAQWLVPHFEKMLYDNALLVPAYLEAWQMTGEPFYREVVQDTLGWVQREMTSPEGAFYSTQDADSEGEEGRFYVWSAAEVESILGPDLATVFSYVYDVSSEGNWEGHNILQRPKTYAQNAALLKVSESELRKMLDEAKQKLYEVRSRRVWPGRDDKVLTSWNGLMLNAFALAAQALEEPSYVTAAERAAVFLLTKMRAADGRLLRTWGAGSDAKLNAYLEDYAFLIDGLVSLYEATFAQRWLESAVRLSEIMIEQFGDPNGPGFFYTGRDHEQLIARYKDFQDGSIPSGNSMAVTALLRLSKLTGRGDLRQRAEEALHSSGGLLSGSPLAAGQMLIALDFWLGPVQEFVVVTDDPRETEQALRAIRSGFRPNKVVALRPAAGVPASLEELVPLLKDRPGKGGVTTYICQNATCQAPLVGAAALEEALR